VSKADLATIIGDRSETSAQRLIHTVVALLAPDCLPLFLSDQWSPYAIALLTHFGHWVEVPHRFKRSRPPKPRWRPLPGLQLLLMLTMDDLHPNKVLIINSLLLAILLAGIPVSVAGARACPRGLSTRPDSATRLTTPPTGASDQNPAFSPDGVRIVFTRFENGYNVGPAGLFLLDPSSGQVARLTLPEDQDNVNLPGSAWNATNDRVVFASDRAEADDLWHVAPDGTDFSRIATHTGLPRYIEPSWSPSAQWIVFEASQPGPGEDGYAGKIWKMCSDGSGLTQLTSDPAFDDRQPNWSPAGDHILFQRRSLPDGQWDIYAITSDGSHLRNVTDDLEASDTDASWSPDGRWIVYSSDHGSLPVPNLFAIPATGGTPIRVTHDDTHEDGAPSWSPDGKWIAFESHPGQDENTPAALWRIAAPVIIGGDKWALWTEGTHLRGANIYQRRVYPDLDGSEFMGPGPVGPPYIQEDFDRLAAMGANYVNISHPGLFTETEPYTVDLDIQANLDNLLAMVTQANLFAVITFRTGPGRSEFWAFWGEDTTSDPEGGWFDPSYYNNRVWGDQNAQDAWVAMWRYTAQRYKDNPVVVGYDLMCEPNSNEVGSYPLGAPLDIWDPDEFYSTYADTLYDWNQLYPRITAAIREVDPDTPILIGGMAYSAVEWLPYLQPTGDSRTVYTVHQYEPFVYTHQEPPDLTNSYPGVFDADEDGNDDQVNRDWLDNLLTTIDTFTATHNVPVAANEYGLMRWEPGADAFMDDEMDLFEERGMNYALWAWEPAWPPWAQEVDAFNFRHGPDPDNHTDVISSTLMNVIMAYWGLNQDYPSTWTCPDFAPPPSVGMEDVQAVANRWLMPRTGPDWNPFYDRDADGDIDIIDIMRVAARWGDSCQGSGPPTPTPTPTPTPSPTPGLSAVNDFLYQLQNLDLTAIGNTAYDLVVMDYSSDGTEAGEFTAEQITALKHSPGGEKTVLAYMSIGEAEDYRFYWQDGWTPGNPVWLDAENPDWPGNYKVHYWDPDWQTIIFTYTDRLLDAGFDGAYLDIIDAYEYYADQGRTTAAQEMADFVAAIRAHAHLRDPDFYIFPQNAPELASLIPAYLNSVDGIGQENIYYGYEDDDVMTPPAITAELEGYLDVFKNAGKLVLTVDYATTPAHVDDAYAKSQAKGYVPFVTVRDLDQLTINPGHEPD